MKTFNEYLDQMREAKRWRSDAQMAEFFGFSRQYLSKVRKTGDASDETCEKIAEAVGAHPYMVMMARDTLKGPEKKAKIIKDFFRHIALLGVVGVVAITAPNSIKEKADLERSTTDKDYRKLRNLFRINPLRRVFF